MKEKLRVVVVGIGNMGLSHARAYDRLESFEEEAKAAAQVIGAEPMTTTATALL